MHRLLRKALRLWRNLLLRLLVHLQSESLRRRRNGSGLRRAILFCPARQAEERVRRKFRAAVDTKFLRKLW